MLANFTKPLQDSIDYERHTCGGQFLAELEDIQRMYKEVMEGLSNVTGAPVPMMNGSSPQDSDTSGQGHGSPSPADNEADNTGVVLTVLPGDVSYNSLPAIAKIKRQKI